MWSAMSGHVCSGPNVLIIAFMQVFPSSSSDSMKGVLSQQSTMASAHGQHGLDWPHVIDFDQKHYEHVYTYVQLKSFKILVARNYVLSFPIVFKKIDRVR